MSCISDNIEYIREEVALLCARNRIKNSVKLCAATKMRTVEEINAAVKAGVDCIGENKVQEARDKYPYVTESVQKHFIGHLQTNKVKYCPVLFDCIQSVDSIAILEALEKSAEANQKRMTYMIEVNISGEESKFGVSPQRLEPFFEHASTLRYMKLIGFMTMLPLSDDVQQLRRHADMMYTLFEHSKRFNNTMIEISELSMGMSQDYAMCIEAGSTMVRIGTKIFGERQAMHS